MLRHLLAAAALVSTILALPAGTSAQTRQPNDPIVVAQAAPKGAAQRAPTAASSGELDTVYKINNWTIGLAGGLPEGTFLPFASEIARNLNEGGEIRVLPIVTPGATENVRDLLYLRGVDIAITHTDVFDHFRNVEKIPNIERRVNYITGLYVSEIHIIVRPEINTLQDLAGKKVSLHTKGAGSSTSGPIVFQRLNIKPEFVYVNNAVALERMKTGEIAGIVHNGGKPNNLIARFKNDQGFKILAIPFDKLDDFYVPASLSSEDYPNFLKPGQRVDTIAVPAVLAVYNWPRTSDRYRRVARFIDLLFERFERFKTPGYQPQWKDINLAAQVPGWQRYSAAEEKLKQIAVTTPRPPAAVDVQLARQQAARAAPGDAAEQERLFQKFLEWSRSQAKR